ncbi:type II toxin-antitoxin system PemK/MazF family toxin [Candidatus Woesearchaeota archaeon]|nr:type II toxin-antitoxin system PemK/MazF family toxin [Candidatus Woesearchaeota archaeon]
MNMMKDGMKYSKGDIVVINFPFSDLVNSKKRPVVIIGIYKNDYIGCAITSNPESEGIKLENFEERNLPLKSKIKFWKVSTIVKNLVIGKIAKISKEDYKKLIFEINELISY